MTEIIPGINQLQIPMGITDNPTEYTNTYLVQGDGGYLLIDPGMNTEEAFNSLKRGISEIGIGFEDITQILATHVHIDHYGLTGRVKQLSQAKILLHHLERNLIIQSMNITMEERSRQSEQWLRTNGIPSLELSQIQMPARGMPRFTPIMPDITLNGGETISTGVFNFQVLWTPGHSPGHICLYEPTQKILFTGDHILPVITPNVSLQSQSDLNPLVDFVNSLNIVKQLDVNLVLPAHEHLFTDLRTRVEEIIERHKQRSSEILKALKAETKTAYQISTEITWMPELGGVSFQNLAPLNKRMAISETLAHLEAMRVDGRVDKSSRDSIIYYRRT
jgi:glyoxylase-like metal-dependent hydrolase (beta-lactamase superfamily II)